MSAPVKQGIRMKRRPKEQVKQQPDPCDEEEPHLLTPIQTSTSASKKVAPKQKAAQPRKPRVPAWRAEAIRKETEFAKAYFSEVDKFELQEELASPEPPGQQTESCTLRIAQQDTENVPPTDDGTDIPELGCTHQPWPDIQHIDPSPQLPSHSRTQSPALVPALSQTPASHSSRRSILDTTSMLPPADEPCITPVQVTSADPITSAITTPQPSTHYYMHHFHRDSVWSCESEEQHAGHAAVAGGSQGNNQRTSQVPAAAQAASKSGKLQTEPSGRSLAKSSVTSSEAALFRSATDVSVATPSELHTPSELFVTPSGDARITPPGGATVEQQVHSASTPGAIAPFVPNLFGNAEQLEAEEPSAGSLSALAPTASDLGASPDVSRVLHTPNSTATPDGAPSIGAAAAATPVPVAVCGERTPPAELQQGQFSACMDSGLPRVPASGGTLCTPASIGALLQSEHSLKHEQAHSTPFARTAAASTISNGCEAQPSPVQQQDSVFSLPAQPASAEIESPASVKFTPASAQHQHRLDGAAAACLHVAPLSDGPADVTPENHVQPQSGTQPLPSVVTALVSSASSIGATPVFSTGTRGSTQSAQHHHDSQDATADSSRALPSASVQFQPSAVRTRSTSPKTGSAASKLSDKSASLPAESPAGSVHTQAASSAMRHSSAKGITPAATPPPANMLQRLQGTDRRSIVDAETVRGMTARVTLCTPPNFHAAASASPATSEGAVQAAAVMHPDSAAGAATDSVAQAAVTSVPSDAKHDVTHVQTAEPSVAAVEQHVGPRTRSASSQMSSPPAHPHTGPTPASPAPRASAQQQQRLVVESTVQSYQAPSTIATDSQLFSQSQAGSQWTLSGTHDRIGAKNAHDPHSEDHAQSSRQEKQPNPGTTVPLHRMSLAFSGHASLAASNTAAPSQQPKAHVLRQRHVPRPPPGPQAAPMLSPAAAAPGDSAARVSIAASSVTPKISSADLLARASVARHALRNSLTATLASPDSPTDRCSQQQSTDVAKGALASAPNSATTSRKPPTPIPSRREQKRLKARASMMVVTNVSAHAATLGVSGGAFGTPRHILPAPAKRSGLAGTSGTGITVQATPQPRTALLTSLLQQRAQRLSNGQSNVHTATASAAPQTPPSLPGSDSAPREHSNTGARQSIAALPPRKSIMPDPSPISEKPAHSAELSTPGSSIQGVNPDGTPAVSAARSAAVPTSVGRLHTATPQSPHSSATQPLETHISSARHRTDASMSASAAHTSGTPAPGQAKAPEVQDDAECSMRESSEGTAVGTVDDEVSEPLTPLEELLMLCEQTEPLQFKAAANELTGGKHVEKLAEGSFKEVFDCGGDVIQVMPIDGSTVINGEEPMPAHEVVPELTAYAQLSLLQTPTPALHDPEGRTSCCAAFPHTKRMLIVRGKYHDPFVKAWKRFHTKWKHIEDKAQNENPSKLPASQLYVIMVVGNGGDDLERFDVKDFHAAKSLILQTALALAVAESCLEFEHRDLHWGNLLVDTVPNSTSQKYRLRGKDWNVRSPGIKICLIDFTLSRVLGPRGTVCSDLARKDMEWLFTQIKDVVNPQSEAYYAMKQQAEKCWQLEVTEQLEGWNRFTPCTNVQWISYLSKILRYKKYKKHKGETYKGVSMTRKEQSALDRFMKDLEPNAGSEWAVSCEKLVHHPFFADMLES